MPQPPTETKTLSDAKRWCLSIFAAFHLLALIIALSANFAPSLLQGRMTSALSFYHVTTAQDYNLLPLELTHGSRLDRPVYFQIKAPSSATWQTLDCQSCQMVKDIGQANNSHTWQNLTHVLTWLATQEPDSPLLAEVVFRLAKQVDGLEPNSRVRLLIPHVPTYDEFEIIRGQEGAVVSDLFDPEILYSANIVIDDEGEVRVVPEQSAELNAKSLLAESSLKQGGGETNESAR